MAAVAEGPWPFAGCGTTARRRGQQHQHRIAGLDGVAAQLRIGGQEAARILHRRILPGDPRHHGIERQL
jgi:hypothetical protein